MTNVLMFLAVIALSLVVGGRILMGAYRFGVCSAQMDADIAADNRAHAIDDAADMAIGADDWDADRWWTR